MRHILCFLMLALCLSAKAQFAQDSVRQTVNRLFIAMKSSDAGLLQSVFADSCILQTIAFDKTTGKPVVKNALVTDFVKQIAALPVNAADERITFKEVMVDADLASVWTPYQFFYNGKFSHCGVNSFQLVRLNGLWKIQYLIDTRRKDKCLN